jgi:hypothetical protein
MSLERNPVMMFFKARIRWHLASMPNGTIAAALLDDLFHNLAVLFRNHRFSPLLAAALMCTWIETGEPLGLWLKKHGLSPT